MTTYQADSTITIDKCSNNLIEECGKQISKDSFSKNFIL